MRRHLLSAAILLAPTAPAIARVDHTIETYNVAPIRYNTSEECMADVERQTDLNVRNQSGKFDRYLLWPTGFSRKSNEGYILWKMYAENDAKYEMTLRCDGNALVFTKRKFFDEGYALFRMGREAGP